MRFFIMCMAFLTLLCSVAQAEAPDIAFETDFEVVYQQLLDAQAQLLGIFPITIKCILEGLALLCQDQLGIVLAAICCVFH